MKLTTNRFVLIALAFFSFSTLSLSAQDMSTQVEPKPDSSNVYLGDAIGRSQIDEKDLPEAVASSVKASEYGNMDMVSVYKIDIVPGNETATDSIMNATTDQSSRRPYAMRGNDMLQNETYYQDTYNDMQTQEQRVGTAQENATAQDMDPSAEESEVQEQMPETVQTYYEIEVNSSSEAFVLLFDESGQLTHSIAQHDM